MIEPSRTLRSRLARRAQDSFVGREAQMEVLDTLLAPDGPVLVHLHGCPGVGKSTLLAQFAGRAREAGAAALVLDCRLVEPTARGFLQELGRALGTPVADVATAARALDAAGRPCLLGLDHYDALRLLDTWLRRDLLPDLPDHCRVVFAGRQRPVPAWETSPAWSHLFRAVPVPPLGTADAHALLESAGVDARDVADVAAVAHGNPLALVMAAAAAAAGGGVPLAEGALQQTMQRLTDLFLAEVQDAATRRALACASVARRITRSLLRTLPDPAEDLYDALARLPFVETRRDGLRLHDAVHEAVARTLRAADPERYHDCRRRVWRQLRSELRVAPASDVWRYTADMLYLVTNPVVREAFFPSGRQELAVEPAGAEDLPEIAAIAARHEGPAAREALEAWWDLPTEAFRVVRDGRGRVAAFFCMAEAADLDDAVRASDPVAATWCRHLASHPLEPGGRTLMLRRWLARDTGEAPSAAQAACWLDIKRTYMELRPHLRRVYLTVVDLPTYADVATQLGFGPLDAHAVALDGTTYRTALLDLGPASVDGWITRLVGDELGLATAGPVDRTRRVLDLDGRAVALTPLEFGLAAHLEDHAGATVTRDELLAGVWERPAAAGNSNVVDAVVKSLRRKLGDEAWRLQTVRGHGYRWQAW